MESQKNTATNLERISGDYKQMKEENNVLAKKLKGAKWVNRKLFYTNRYFLMNNASRNKEFDWSHIFCCSLSLLFLFESFMNHCCMDQWPYMFRIWKCVRLEIIQCYRVRCHSGYRVILGFLADYKITRCCYRRLKWPLPLDQEYRTPPWPRIPKRTYLQTKVSSVWKRDRDVSPPLPKNTPHKKGSL